MKFCKSLIKKTTLHIFWQFMNKKIHNLSSTIRKIIVTIQKTFITKEYRNKSYLKNIVGSNFGKKLILCV